MPRNDVASIPAAGSRQPGSHSTAPHAPAAPEGEGRGDPASQAITRIVLLRALPWLIPFLLFALLVALLRGG